ncbi:hypothetical protein ACFFJY_10415 [Fictibacillus aquaticus]|uniref:Uncharacterized protein n=1 Tax=Fictibacillus aquaticus TaxID=2021314 RepID=A0A235FEH0_9BACL|nr:hypothetical protein [Fictibacillus aquaticus]OYD59790.1 hypothetical protein CGZ90_01860 [Fictibacillus aquaticus]
MDMKENMTEQIIENYKKDEGMMILVFAQWCVNNDLDPKALYLSVYPDQTGNDYVLHMLEQTVPKEEAEMIEASTAAAVLSLFGNEELAFAVSEASRKAGK